MLSIINVITKNIANIIAATKAGDLNIFCNAIDIIIVAIGYTKSEKNPWNRIISNE